MTYHDAKLWTVWILSNSVTLWLKNSTFLLYICHTKNKHNARFTKTKFFFAIQAGTINLPVISRPQSTRLPLWNHDALQPLQKSMWQTAFSLPPQPTLQGLRLHTTGSPSQGQLEISGSTSKQNLRCQQKIRVTMPVLSAESQKGLSLFKDVPLRSRRVVSP